MQRNDRILGNFRKVLYANGYGIADAREALGYAPRDPGTWRAAALRLGVDYSVLEASDDAEKELYGEFRLGENLKLLMRFHGKSWKELAREVYISNASVSGYMSGATRPRPAVAEALARYFGITARELMYGVPEVAFRCRGRKAEEAG